MLLALSINKVFAVTITRDEQTLRQKLQALKIGISKQDNKQQVAKKIQKFLESYQLNPDFKDEKIALITLEEATEGVLEGGYGIGAAIVDEDSKILLSAHNKQLQQKRSDLHAEMQLLNMFEENPKFAEYKNDFNLKPGLKLYTSTEPCPMCFTRLLIVGINSYYVAPGPDDGMANKKHCLPHSWHELAEKHQSKQAEVSPVLQEIAHLLFHTYLLKE